MVFNRRYRPAAVSVLFVLTILSAVAVLQLFPVVLAENDSLNTCGAGNSMLVQVDKKLTANFPQESKLDANNIAFLNWNIYKGNGDNWQYDLLQFARYHNVMTLQEALLNEELTGLLSIHGFEWVMNKAFYLNGIASGVMTVSDANTVHSCGMKHREPVIRLPKSALISYYEIEGSEQYLLVANIHSVNFTLGIKSYRQQLNDLYQAIKHHDGPMIVAGDFNSWSQARMNEVNQLVEKLSLSDLEYQVNNKTHVMGMAIDHVFYRQLTPVKHQVWDVASSDHNPISVNFAYTSATYKI